MNDDKKILHNTSQSTLSIANFPRGLSAALASDVRAMQVFSEMADEPRDAFIEGARGITDKNQMRKYVSEIRKN